MENPPSSALASANKPESGVPLSEYMWSESQSLANAALETQFLHGIRHGSLNPEQYGAFCVQDVAYTSYAVEDYNTSIENAKMMKEVRAFLIRKRDGYQEYLKSSLLKWHIGDPRAIVLDKAVQQYIDFERKVAQCLNPVYLLVAMMPCSRLWGWLANQMLPYEGSPNAYSFWIRENKQGSGGKSLEKFVDEHSQGLDRKLALMIYQTSMICEGNFMRSACDQVLIEPHYAPGLEDALLKARSLVKGN